MPQQDYRAKLQPKAGGRVDVLGPADSSNILFPLHQTSGVLFPYTPTITTGSVAEYDQTPFTHSNYGYNAYVRSYPKPISITAEFTAQSNDEAVYLLAVMAFFRTVTKSFFGITPYAKAGTPPPVLNFNYLGTYQFNQVPVVVKDFSFTLDASIDYVPVDTTNSQLYSANMGISLPQTSNGGYTYVPTHMTATIELETQYVPINLRNEFNLDDFRTGRLYNKGYI